MKRGIGQKDFSFLFSQTVHSFLFFIFAFVGTNIMKESIQTFSNIDGTEKKDDKWVATMEEGIVLLKQMIETKKSKIRKDKKKAMWAFKSSPHEQFDKTLDDTFKCFVTWTKKDGKFNISKVCQ